MKRLIPFIILFGWSFIFLHGCQNLNKQSEAIVPPTANAKIEHSQENLESKQNEEFSKILALGIQLEAQIYAQVHAQAELKSSPEPLRQYTDMDKLILQTIKYIAVIWGIGIACVWLFLLFIWFGDRWELNRRWERTGQGYGGYFLAATIWPFYFIIFVVLLFWNTVMGLREANLRRIREKRRLAGMPLEDIEKLHQQINTMLEQEGIKD